MPRTRSRLPPLALLSVLVLVASSCPTRAGADDDPQARLQAAVAEIRRRGEPVTFEEVLTQRARIPDEENSALILVRAFALLEAGGAEAASVLDRIQAPELGVRHSEQVRKLNRSWHKLNAEALALIGQAAQLPKSQYPAKWTGDVFACDYPHLGGLRQAARVCARAAAFHAEEGDPEAAADALLAVRRMAASLGGCVTTVEALCRMGVDDVFVRALERVLALGQMPSGRLSPLAAEIAREQQELSLTHALISERTAPLHFYILPTDRIGGLVGGGSRLPDAALTPEARTRSALYLIEATNRAIEASRLPEREKVAGFRLLNQERVPTDPELYLAGVLLPAFGSCLQHEVRTRTGLHVAGAALAVEQWRLAHGQWPDSVEQTAPAFMEVVPDDPFSAGRLRYRRKDGGVVVYSVGPDGVDDGGITREEAAKSAGKSLRAGWDIAFRLLEPARRGARQRTLAEEGIADAGALLRAAAQLGHTGVVEALLAAKVDVNAPDERGRTPLHVAALAGRTGMATFLLDNGAELNAMDNAGRTPTYLAAQAGHRELADLLTVRGGVE